MYDPLSILDQYTPAAIIRGAMRGSAGPRQSTAKFQPLPEDEEESLLRDLLHSSMGGLQWVGETLDKPGRAVRGTLNALAGGKAGGSLLNLIPLSDTLGITDPQESVSGRELLTTAGLTNPNDPEKWEAADFAGFGAEVLTDPLTFINPLAKTTAGLKAAKAGTLTKGVGPSIRAGERSLARVGFPGIGYADLGTGSGAAKAGEIIDKGVDAALYGEFSPVPYFRAPLDTMVQGRPEREFQRAMSDIDVPGRVQQSKSAVMEPLVELGQRAHERTFKGLSEGQTTTASRLLRQLREFDGDVTKTDLFPRTTPGVTTPPLAPPNVPLPDKTARDIAEKMHLQATDLVKARPNIVAELSGYAKEMGDNYDDMLRTARDNGIPIEEFEDEFIKYAHRQTRLHPSAGMWRQFKHVLSTKTASQLHRKEFLDAIPGGSGIIDEMVMNPMISGKDATVWSDAAARGLSPKEALNESAEYIRANYLNGRADTEGIQQSRQLAAWLAKRDPSYAEKGVPFWGGPLGDLQSYGKAHAKMMGHANARMELVKRFASDTIDAPDGVEVGEFLNRSNMGLKLVGAGPMPSGAPMAGIKPALEKLATMFPAGTTGDDVAKLRLPNEIAGPAIKWVASWVKPDEVRPLIDAYKAYLDVNKAWLTQAFPAFFSRNHATGMYYNWMDDAFDPDFQPLNPQRYIQPMVDMSNVQMGKAIKPIAGLNTPAAFADAAAHGGVSELASKELFIKMKAAGVGFDVRTSQMGDFAADRAIDIPFPDAAQGGILARAGNIVSQAVPRTLGQVNPVDLNNFSYLKQMQRIGNASEWNVRGANVIAKLRQGFSWDEAVRSMKRVHFDYTDLTDTERNLLKLAVPFWTWTKKNVPVVVKELAAHPGGKMAQSIRASNAGRQGDENFVPPWIGEGAAIPIPGGEGARYLTNFGLPFEQTLGMGAIGPGIGGSLVRTGQKLMSQLAPPLKAPVEVATGKDLFTGRDLTELYPHPTDNPLANSILHNFPTARTTTTVRTLSDPRKDLIAKGVNLFTGVKVSDVSGGPEAAIQRAGRKANEEALKRSPNIKAFTRFYAPPDVMGSLTPEEVNYLRLQEGLVRKAKVAAEKKRKAAGVS